MKLNNTSIYIIACTLLLIIGGACEKSTTEDDSFSACGVQNPILNIEWLNIEYNKIKDAPETNGIVLYTYDGEEVIEVQNATYSSTNQHQYYCDGTKLNLDNPKDFESFKNNRIEIRVLYGTKIWIDNL